MPIIQCEKLRQKQARRGRSASVLELEKTKTTQQNEIDSLKRRVKKFEKKTRTITHKLKRLYKVGATAKVESSGDEESLGEDASKQGRIDVTSLINRLLSALLYSSSIQLESYFTNQQAPFRWRKLYTNAYIIFRH
ncbi:hypothetical protein Tco_0182863 [Tanacetum coccineum]